MGSKLEYWFLLTKIAVMVLGGMIEERRRRPHGLTTRILWHVDGL